MNTLDLMLLITAALAAIGGWRLGLITRALGWAGALLGIAIGVSLVPAIVGWLNPPGDTGVLLLSAGCFVLLGSVGQGIGVAIGSRLKPPEQEAFVRSMDSAGGSALGILGVVILVWLLVPLMATTSGWVASVTRNSLIARSVAQHLPDPPRQVAALENSLVGGTFPELFAGLSPAPELPPPPQGSPVDAATLERVSLSTARVQGRACDLVQSGSAFSVGGGLWVTNAHVVAGSDQVELTSADGDTVGGSRVVGFDPRADLAVISSRLERPALTLRPSVGDEGGLVMGFPGGGQFDPSPFVIGERLSATGYDIYDEALVRRDLLVLAAELEPGDSGSALVDGNGEVIGTAVAVAPDRAGVAYALDTDAVEDLLAEVDGPTNTGRCLG